jgi:uncharacterized protein
VRRAVLDPGVLVSALITPSGAPAKLLVEIRAGGLELIVSSHLLKELEDVLLRQKFRRYVDIDAMHDYVALLRREALVVADPDDDPPLRSPDPDDDYLIALAFAQNATLVSGDNDLLDLIGGAPILAPADLLCALGRRASTDALPS